ncbi:MAG: hypothetical protein KAT56_02650, partial [Sedimentisphaerales bacterium]|nr:hypothetical protein [Sedimentisphaerales bacterium]
MCKHLFIAGMVIFLFGSVALADWDVGDPHKMHFPQLPDPDGWDVYSEYPQVLADDWMCSQTGPVTDVHVWGSWKSDTVGTINNIHVSIHSDDRSGPFSKPGDLLWERDFGVLEFTKRIYGTGDQGWYDPGTGNYNLHDH